MSSDLFQKMRQRAMAANHRDFIRFIDLFQVQPEVVRRLRMVHRLAEACDDFFTDLSATDAAKNARRIQHRTGQTDGRLCEICLHPGCGGPSCIDHVGILLYGLDDLLEPPKKKNRGEHAE